MDSDDAETTPDTQDSETYGDYSVDDEDQLQPGDTLDADADDPLDHGYDPPEGYSPAQGYGNTPREEEVGETLEQRIAQEVPEPDPYSSGPANYPTDPPSDSPEQGALHVVTDDEDQDTV